ncbi:DUF72 domain-containing protein [Mucilaginibacter sp. BT774]|uniref:DUF72 domain-containing protein n=1 Tax=Mucilaginibacter sp. BT774 TaxID=3062276 RepID=UPI0026773AC8|nr:DUF72 domain-containing protein [Mucilaginibacter sp. BT774]MDO3628598.1 DUF72 domain-containing protein [Mucilaginibacter sp. BT774]
MEAIRVPEFGGKEDTTSGASQCVKCSTMANKGEFYAGTSGIKIPMPKRDFPEEHQEKSRLRYYANHENSIEINSSFYKLPQAKTIARWTTEVPAYFRFTFKLWKEITHQKDLLFNPKELTKFMTAIAGMEEKKGCLLVQFPPSLRVSALSQLKELLETLQSFNWPVAVEFRDASWHQDLVYELLATYQAAMVIQDKRQAPTPMEVTADKLVYLRFHGPAGNYKGSYSEDFLNEYATYIREWQQEGRTVYAYFNNTAGDALSNLNCLKRRLKVE